MTTTQARPVLFSPTALRPADATMTTFSWSAPSTDGLHLQISTDRGFRKPLWDVPVAGLTQITLEKALPRLGETYYWRVGREGAWSAPAAFEGATDEDVQQWEWARVEAEAIAERAQRREREQAQAYAVGAYDPYTTAATTRPGALVWIYLLVVGFSVLLGLGVYAAI